MSNKEAKVQESSPSKHRVWVCMLSEEGKGIFFLPAPVLLWHRAAGRIRTLAPKPRLIILRPHSDLLVTDTTCCHFPAAPYRLKARAAWGPAHKRVEERK